MRNLNDLNVYRRPDLEQGFAGMEGDDTCGIFTIQSPNRRANAVLRVVAAVGDGWDHLSISVSAPRTPTWREMEYIKRLFFKKDETAMQLHVPPKEHINNHEYVLHLWRPHDKEIPRPPAYMV